MGSNTSKVTQINAGNNKTETEKSCFPSTPIHTPNNSKRVSKNSLVLNNSDPRSPSRHILRTPIELLPVSNESDAELFIERTDAENTNVETPLKRHVILGIDPRSPTLELQRTPIVVSASPDNDKKKLPGNIRNKNLDKVRNGALLSSPPLKKLLENNPATINNNIVVTPRLLESTSVVQSKVAEVENSVLNKRKSFILLETNVDYTETDIDAVIQEKYLGNSMQNSLVDDSLPLTEDLVEPFIEEQNKLDKDNLEENISTNTNDYAEETDRAKEEDIQEIPDDANDDIEPEIAIENNLVEEIAEIDSVETSLEEIEAAAPNNVIIENVCAKSAPVSPPNNKIVVDVTPLKSKSQPVTPPTFNLIADIKELDKKLTNLIYEDEDLVVCPRAVQIKDQNRTPLATRNGDENTKINHINNNNPSKLKVNDKPSSRKSQFAVSKIPVFKDKKVKVQCENTPPSRGARNIQNKQKKTQWDSKDHTLVI